MFGTQPTGGGLFGNNSAPSGGLFGTSVGGGLGGTSAAGLFGTGGASTTGGGLFGGGATIGTGNPAAGMFGGGGSFGGAPSGAGLFGNHNPAPAVGGGLFGAGATSGGLFGGATATPATSGIFGQGTGSALGGGLFSGTGTAAPSGGLGIFGAQPANSGLSFGTQPAANPLGTTAMFGSMAPNTGASLLQPQSSVQINGTQIDEFNPDLHKDHLYVMSYNNMPKHLGAPLKLLRLKDYIDIKGGQVNPKIAPYMKNYIDVCNGRAQPNVMPGGLYGPVTSGGVSSAMGGLGGAMGGLSTTGGLFGTAAAGAPANGGIFGQKSATSGGLFGATTIGGPTTQPAAVGLFGTGATTAPSTGGLFGGATTATATGGLFGGGMAPATTTGGLFGGATAAPTGGLFSTNAPTVAPTTGGLFGNSQPSTTGGLFGGQTTHAPATGGLFGGGQPATTGTLFGGQATQAPTTGGLFGSGAASTQPTGMFGGQAQGIAQPQQMAGYPVVRGGITLPESGAPYALYYVPLSEKEKGQGYKLPDFVANDPNFPGHHDKDHKSSTQDESAAVAAHQRAELLAGMRTGYANSRNRAFGQNPLDTLELNNSRHQMRPPRAQVCPLNTSMPLRPNNNLSAIAQLSHGAHWQTLTIPPTTIKIGILVDIEGYGEIVIEVEQQTLVANLIRRLVDEVMTPTTEDRERYLSEWSLQLNGVTLDHMKAIKECNINCQTLNFTRAQQGSAVKSAPVSRVPILTRSGYQTEPAYSQLCRMTESELKSIHNFTIQNQHGKILFFDETDVRGLDLDKIISIEPGQIEVYPEGTDKPPRGQGLNKTALVTFFNYGLKSKKNIPDFIKRFKQRAGEMGAIYINHDVDQDSITIQIEASD